MMAERKTIYAGESNQTLIAVCMRQRGLCLGQEKGICPKLHPALSNLIHRQKPASDLMGPHRHDSSAAPGPLSPGQVCSQKSSRSSVVWSGHPGRMLVVGYTGCVGIVGMPSAEKTVDIACLMHHPGWMHRVIQITHENSWLVRTDQLLHGLDGTARLLNSGGLTGVAFDRMALIGEMRGPDKPASDLVRPA